MVARPLPLIPTRYYGGKGRPGLLRWIRSLLPDDAWTYVEPFSGLASVLLARQPAKVELINDADGRLVCLLRAVRDSPRELADLLAWTPNSREEFAAALEAMDDASRPAVERAAAVWVVIEQGLTHSLGGSPHWARNFTGQGWSRTWGAARAALPERLLAVAVRLLHTQIECGDGLDLIASAAPHRKTLIYLDPPYRHAVTRYGASVDHAALVAALVADTVRARIAVSGYEDDYPELDDHPGWRRSEMQVPHTTPNGGAAPPVREVVWTNYLPPGQLPLVVAS